MRTGSLRAALPVLVLLLGLLASVGLNARFKDPRPAEGDSPAYLIAAHNLTRHGLFSELPDASAPGVGREPAYAAFLAALMRLPTGLAAFDPSCLADRARCPPQRTAPRSGPTWFSRWPRRSRLDSPRCGSPARPGPGCWPRSTWL